MTGALGRQIRGGLPRRGLLAAGIGALAATSVAGAAASPHPEATASGSATVPFHGTHQAGIATAVQDRVHVTAFDVVDGAARADLVRLMQRWTAAAARMTAGLEAEPDGAVGGSPLAPPGDTGEALGLPASRLTVTVGFGPGLFDGRFGLAGGRPDPLVGVPRLPGEDLDPDRSNGDLVVQACADDPQVAVHAVRMLAKLGFGTVRVRWSQLGFGKTSTTTSGGDTPRNLFGFKDGTANVLGTDPAALTRHVWVAPGDGPDWLAGGSYLLARRIRMQIETWDRTSLGEQEQVVGRSKGEGAPLGSPTEHSPVVAGSLPEGSHVRLMHESNPALAGARILRRGYSFVDGSDGLGRLDAGLFFLSYQRDPRTSVIPMLRVMAAHDRLAEYLVTTGSGLWAVPPGVRAGGYWGEQLLG